MPEKDPTNWGLATWLLALGMSCAGGLNGQPDRLALWKQAQAAAQVRSLVEHQQALALLKNCRMSDAVQQVELLGPPILEPV